jgi:hypothetical protein
MIWEHIYKENKDKIDDILNPENKGVQGGYPPK